MRNLRTIDNIYTILSIKELLDYLKFILLDIIKQMFFI